MKQTTQLANCPHPPECMTTSTRAADGEEREYCTLVAELRCSMCGALITCTGEGPGL